MFDIHFYMKFGELKKRMMQEKLDWNEIELFYELEKFRSREPVVYNIETTNNCNMNCYMCPRPTKMTRKVVDMDLDTFQKVAEQVKVFTPKEMKKWYKFVEDYYGIKNEMSENHFFTHIIPYVLVLHGYGEPLIDRTIVEKVQICSDLGIPSYFSCNPWNLKDAEQSRSLMDAGLGYIKFSTDSANDFSVKQIRGKQADFSDSFSKIKQFLKIRELGGYDTTVVITMLDLNRKGNQEDFEKLKEKFKDLDVYIYLKSQDQLWYEETGAITKSIHWREPCQFPWSSMTVKSDGKCTQCVEDFNNEIVLGDAKRDSLFKIWNDIEYEEFRKEHIQAMSKSKIKCRTECDMKLVGECIEG